MSVASGKFLSSAFSKSEIAMLPIENAASLPKYRGSKYGRWMIYYYVILDAEILFEKQISMKVGNGWYLTLFRFTFSESF